MKTAHRFTAEEKEFMREFVPGHSYKEIQEAFEERFGSVTIVQVRNFIHNNKLNTGRTGRFSKGHVPHNKGQKMSAELYLKYEPTMYKPGLRPHNTLDVGTEIITEDGYIKIKVAEPNKWKFKHIWVWEQHKGELRPNHCIVFRDRDKQNCDISNLLEIHRHELLILNKNHMFTENAELNDVMINIAKVMQAAGMAKFDIKHPCRKVKAMKKRMQKSKREE